MKLNIFKIPITNIESLKKKIQLVGMSNKYSDKIGDWNCIFYLSDDPDVEDIAWVNDYVSIVPSLLDVKNKIHCAIYLCTRQENCFALTYGKSHFYVRNFCDDDFGLEMAKRIADENDVKQKASKRFSGRKKKEIKSFIKDTRLDSESGESIDYISAAIIKDKQHCFGEKSKFGSSLVISRDDLVASDITSVLDDIIGIISNDAARFDLPKTYEIKEQSQIDSFDKKLLEQIKKDISSIETENDSYDLVGTDFIFYTNECYILHLGHKKSPECLELSHLELKKFIDENNIKDEEIFNIKVEIKNENRKKFRKLLYDMIEFMIPDENIVLENGKWKKFNKEYIEQINDSVDSVEVEVVEDIFKEISQTEPIFNNSEEILKAGYQKADKDFSKINIGTGYTVEAWDLQKDDTVYAIKFGNTQKLVYVCSQGMGTLDIIRNNANLKKLDKQPKKYCLWMGFERVNIPEKLSAVKSIILKQHVDMFARKCREIGIEPVLKFSKKI